VMTEKDFASSSSSAEQLQTKICVPCNVISAVYATIFVGRTIAMHVSVGERVLERIPLDRDESIDASEVRRSCKGVGTSRGNIYVI
jgi:hypothetical protein